MTNAIILKCRPESQFHFGRGGLDVEAALHDTSEWPHSDTIFSALLSTAALVADQTEVDNLREFFGFGKIKISSGFFCLENTAADAGKDERRFLYFLPRPEHYILHEKMDFKAVNSLQFISTGVWESGLTPADDDWHDTKKTKTFQRKFMVTEEEGERMDVLDADTKICSIVTYPRVYARRSGATDTFYFLANVVLHELPTPWQTHFYFLLDADAETRESEPFQLLKTAIALLPDCGIGGERSGGCGHLDGVLWEEFKLEMPKSSGFVTASLALPKDEPDLAKFQYYKTFLRGGRHTALDKQIGLVRMIGEGAYLSAEAAGRLELLKQGAEVPYYRNGMAYCLPVHKNTQPPKP